MGDVNKKLIELVKEHDILYNPTHVKYRDQNYKRVIWDDIGRQLKMSGSNARDIWCSLRLSYIRHMQRVRNNPNHKPKYKFFEYKALMEFLGDMGYNKIVKPRPSTEANRPRYLNFILEPPSRCSKLGTTGTTYAEPLPEIPEAASTKKKRKVAKVSSSKDEPESIREVVNVPSSEDEPEPIRKVVIVSSSRNEPEPIRKVVNISTSRDEPEPIQKVVNISTSRDKPEPIRRVINVSSKDEPELIRQAVNVSSSKDEPESILESLGSKKELDAVDHLFASYQQTFRKFSIRKQSELKVKMAKMFAFAEIGELDDFEENY